MTASARRRMLASLLLVLASLASGACTLRAPADVAKRRVIVLGLDGLDHGLVSQMLAEGKLPNIARLAKMGGFQPLLSAIPPQSPVAWSDFTTGQDAGTHGIFDFIHRDPKTMQPYLSTSRTVPPRWMLPIGEWQIPLSSGKVELLRRGQPFWEALERRGIHTEVLRIPANFPPSGKASIELSGMGTPDLLGDYGTFTYITTDRLAFLGKHISGGVIERVEIENGLVRAQLTGPGNPVLRAPTDMVAELEVHIDPDQPIAKIVVGSEERLLREGEWSDWVKVAFSYVRTQSVTAQVRFYLRRVRPELELYVSPLNLDPEAPALPISNPPSFAADLARATGRFYTQGMPENTGALEAGVLTPQEFLTQAGIAGDEVIDQFHYMLSRFKSGLLFYYFGNADLISHMMWRPMDPQHPAYNAAVDAPFADAVPRVYEKLDSQVGYALDHMGSDTLLVVMSDHGFTSLRRFFSLNAWLHQNGYLAVKDESLPAGLDYFRNVDFSRTRAYAFGLNGLYINLRGRERDGIVAPEQRSALIAEICARLGATVDPDTKRPAIGHTYVRDTTYADGGQRDIGPDIVVGFAKGTRSSNTSSLGEVGREIFTNNDKEWSGDHCMDTPDVPGILATSRPLKRPVVRLKDLAAALVAEFGIEDFPQAIPAKAAGTPSPTVTLSEAKGLGDPSAAARPQDDGTAIR